MHFVPRSRPGDQPAPPDVDELAARLPCPLFTLVPQEHVEEFSLAAGWNESTRNGHSVMQAVTLSYTLWRNPARRDDPVNAAELSPEMSETLDQEPPWPLPEWMVWMRERMRYPLLWDAVRTTHVGDESAGFTVERSFVEHLNYILMNSFREERMRGEFPGTLADPTTEDRIEHGFPVPINGASVDGMRFNKDPHVYGVAAGLGDRYLTAVFARKHLPLLRLDFVARPGSGNFGT